MVRRVSLRLEAQLSIAIRVVREKCFAQAFATGASPLNNFGIFRLIVAGFFGCGYSAFVASCVAAIGAGHGDFVFSIDGSKTFPKNRNRAYKRIFTAFGTVLVFDP